MKIPVTLSLSEETDQAVERYAEKTRRTKSAVVEMAVDLFFKSMNPAPPSPTPEPPQ
jgi:predicted transcriptional regulator